MGKNVIVTTHHEITTRLSKVLPKTKHNPKKMNEAQTQPPKDCCKLIALQEALQDPITACEEI